jgi:putative oxidoreductase
MNYLVLLGRILFAAIFIGSGISHFSGSSISYAAGHGVTMASFLVPLTGALALIGGISVLLGYKARIGAWLLVIFLLPVTFMMHQFWKVGDPASAMMQHAMFMKNLALIGASLLIAYFGSGPMSLSKIKTKK